MPRRSRSAYSRRMERATGDRSILSPRSHRRRSRRRSSGHRVHARRAGGRDATFFLRRLRMSRLGVTGALDVVMMARAEPAAAGRRVLTRPAAPIPRCAFHRPAPPRPLIASIVPPSAPNDQPSNTKPSSSASIACLATGGSSFLATIQARSCRRGDWSGWARHPRRQTAKHNSANPAAICREPSHADKRKQKCRAPITHE